MKPTICSLLIVAILSAGLLALPAGASLVLSDFSVQPTTYPLPPKATVNVTEHVTLHPLDEITFREKHRVQMQTGLLNATWNIRIYVDGVPGAQQSASGTSAFINGFLLSYGTEHDVSFVATVRGTVPDTPGQQVVLLTIAELDSTGSVVTDSAITMSEPVAGPVTATTVTRTSRTTAVPAEETTPTPTEAGVWWEIAVVALCAAAALISGGRKGRSGRSEKDRRS